MISITIDLDWAPAEVIIDTIEILDSFNVKATIFCTHLVEIDGHELAIHPNFETREDPLIVISDLLAMFPNAQGVRSHALLTSTRYYQLYKKVGLRYSSNYYMGQQAIDPFFTVSNMLEIPIYFEDDINFMDESPVFDIRKLDIESKKLKVFNFHPIHLFLNTHSSAHYQDAKPHYHDPQELSKKKGRKPGTRDLFIQLLEYIQKMDLYENVLTLSAVDSAIQSK